jgi:hypothetical protein
MKEHIDNIGKFRVASIYNYRNLTTGLPLIPEFKDPNLSINRISRSNRYLKHQEKRLIEAIKTMNLNKALAIYATLIQRSFSFRIAWLNKVCKGWYWTLSADSVARILDRVHQESRILDGNILYKRTYIPKGDGRLRPLGVPSIESRIINAMWAHFMQKLLGPLLPDNQHGFRKNHSILTAWKDIWKHIGSYKYAYEFDLTAFFNNVSPRYVTQALRAGGFPESLISYISRVNTMFPQMDASKLVEEQEMRKHYEGGKEVWVKSGLPQGLPWSPILSMYALAYAYRNVGGHLVQYADDGVLLTNDMNEVRELQNTEAVKNGIIISSKLKKDGTFSRGFIGNIITFLGHSYNRIEHTIQLANGNWVPLASLSQEQLTKIIGKTYTDNPIKDWHWFVDVTSWMYGSQHTFSLENLNRGVEWIVNWIYTRPKTVERRSAKFFHIMRASTVCSELLLKYEKNRPLVKMRSFDTIYGRTQHRMLFSIQDIFPLDIKYLGTVTPPKEISKSLARRRELLTKMYGKSILRLNS